MPMTIALTRLLLCFSDIWILHKIVFLLIYNSYGLVHAYVQWRLQISISSLFCRFLALFYRLFGDFGAAPSLFPIFFTFLNRRSWRPSTVKLSPISTKISNFYKLSGYEKTRFLTFLLTFLTLAARSGPPGPPIGSGLIFSESSFNSSRPWQKN